MPRLLRVLLALWLAVLTAEPARVHTCPMHDGLALSQAAQPADAHAGHMGHGAPGNDDSSKHACSCIGTCSVALGPVPAPVAVLDAAVITGNAAGIPEHLRAVVAAAHAIPFANGPPLS